MPKFTVDVEATRNITKAAVITVEVEADDESEAEDKACDLITDNWEKHAADPKIEWDVTDDEQGDFETASATPIDEEE